MARSVTVELYNAEWKERFLTAAQALRKVFGELVVEVHHIGSTSVPGLSAKPIIDLCLVVSDIQAVDGFNGRMEALGYVPKGENGIPGRRFFMKGTEERRDWHVHTFQVGHPDIGRHLRFRDYLIAHPAEAQAYGRLKQELAKCFPHDIEGYMAGKDAFIKEIDQKALAWIQR